MSYKEKDNGEIKYRLYFTTVFDNATVYFGTGSYDDKELNITQCCDELNRLYVENKKLKAELKKYKGE